MPLLKVDEKKKPLVTVVAVLAIVASLTWIYMTQCQSNTPKVNLNPFLAVGQVMAEETAKLLDNKGEVVIVAMDTKKMKIPHVEAQLKTFNDTLKKQGGVTVMATESLSAEALGMVGPEMGLSSDNFFKVLEKYPNASAIVSFVGAPMLKDDEIARLPANTPKIVAFSAMGMGLKKLFEENVIQVAIVPNFEAKPGPQKKPETLREWFDQYYKVVTKEAAPSLPF